MKIMVTSFGFSGPPPEEGEATPFHKMPPLNIRYSDRPLIPDFSSLLLARKLIMDEESFDWLQSRGHGAYRKVAEAYQQLKIDGFVELVSFDTLISKYGRLHDAMMKADLESIDRWLAPLRQSTSMWRDFMKGAGSQFGRPIHTDIDMAPEVQRVYASGLHSVNQLVNVASGFAEILDAAIGAGDTDAQDSALNALKEILGSYLSYVNANLVLAFGLEAGFHDWADFDPFYQVKLGGPRNEFEKGQELRKLFEISLPELRIRDASDFMRAVTDPRIEELRTLVDDAVRGEVEFDEAFAKAVLLEAFRREVDIAKMKRITSYATLPVGMIPWVGTPLQKIAEEAVGLSLEKRTRRGFGWFYLLSEVSTNGDNT